MNSHVQVTVGGFLVRRLGRPASGHWTLTVELLPGQTLGGLLAQLARAEPCFSEVIADGCHLQTGIVLLYNGRSLEWASAVQLELRDGDHLAFYPMVAGGA